jgi:hypothetical protein
MPRSTTPHKDGIRREEIRQIFGADLIGDPLRYRHTFFPEQHSTNVYACRMGVFRSSSLRNWREDCWEGI